MPLGSRAAISTGRHSPVRYYFVARTVRAGWERTKDKYIGQMRGYAEAIESITGRPVVETLIHMPALGKMFRIS